MIEPRLRVAVVTLGDPEWLHALAEPFNKTLRDRGLGEHCCFMRLLRLSRAKGLTATLRSYILGGAGYHTTVVILDRTSTRSTAASTRSGAGTPGAPPGVGGGPPTRS